jgi:hypothetical protein
MNSLTLRVWLERVAIALLLFTVAGCATRKIDWAARVGTYTFDQAVVDFGPPDKHAKLTDGTTVAEWVTQRGYTSTYYAPGYGYPYRRHWGYYSMPVSTSSPNYLLRLTFDPAGRLTGWKKFSN